MLRQGAAVHTVTRHTITPEPNPIGDAARKFATVTEHKVTGGAVSFQGNPAVEVSNTFSYVAEPLQGGVVWSPTTNANLNEYCAPDSSAASVRILGTLVNPSRFDFGGQQQVVFNSITVYQPFFVLWHLLGSCQSYSYSSTTLSKSWDPANPEPPNLMPQDSTVTETVRFKGMARVTVPAGTFDACEFESTTVTKDTRSVSTVTATGWIGVGNGLPLKAIGRASRTPTPIPGATVTTIELLSASIDGQPVTP
ncbi:MAG: hypothetical protein ABI589_14620 [Burkholderiales bacterium]